MPAKPDLRLQAELVFPSGATKRLDCDTKTAADRPTGVSFKTQRYTGFADAACTLSRPIGKEYPDLGLLNGFNLIGYDGSIAFEGRTASLPRSLEGTPKIMLAAQGWMAHATDQPFVEAFVDRDLSKWSGMSAAATVRVSGEGYMLGNTGQVSDEAGHPAVEMSFAGNWASPFKPQAQAWWHPHPGVTIGALYYNFAAYNPKTMNSADTKWVLAAYVLADDNAGANDKTAAASLFPGPSAGYLTATGTRVAAALQMFYSVSPEGTAGATYFTQWRDLAIYGTHGLTRRGADPGGLYASDMVKYIAQTYAPKLDTSGVKESTFIIPHCSFLEETKPYDAFQTLNAYHRWELNVYEKRRLDFYPIDLTDYDWEIRLSDPGTTASLQGDDVTALCNGVVVRYRNLATGLEERLTPAKVAALKDESPDNPANLNGLQLYTTLSLSVPTTEEGAIQIGRIYLNEFNQAKSPGSITVQGHVRDKAGHWQPGWKVRASERLIIADLPNDSVRVVAETQWDHDTKQMTIAVDSSFKRLDAILARLGVAVESSGLVLP